MTRALAPTPQRWPDGKRLCVVVTVNFDAELALLGPDPSAASLEKTLSIFRYGAVRGAPRLLEVLAERSVPTTWFFPGALVDTSGALLHEVVAAGHGLGARGLRLERFDRLGADERLGVLQAAAEALGALGSHEPLGFRLPSGEWPPNFGAQLLDAGFGWSSSWAGDDVPFHLPGTGDRSIVEVPSWHTMNDRLAFTWNFAPPMPLGQSRIASYDDVLENWLLELEGCRREGLCLVVQLHPEVVGTPGRIDLVRRFLDAVAEPGDAWVASGAAVASWWSEHGAPQASGHPVDVLRRVSPLTLT